MFSIPDFLARKASGRPIAMLTCYDAAFAAILERTDIDAVLVGDSVAMVVHGMESTLGADVGLVEAHVRAVRAGGPELCIIADMPFLSTRMGLEQAVIAAGRLMRAGANAVKIEGKSGHETLIPHLVASGIPVMGHLGLTPQSVNVFGGYRVQGKEPVAARQLREDALALQELGCFSLVLECVPAPLATEISASLVIPAIGIGAGPSTDGQILVLHDMLGLSNRQLPRFVRTFIDGAELVAGAARSYIDEVHQRSFPSAGESYGAVSPEAQAAGRSGGNGVSGPAETGKEDLR